MLTKIRPIAMDAAQDAYANAERARADYAEMAKIKRQLAATIGGEICNCRLEDRVRAMFPGWQISYCAAGRYDNRKYLNFRRATDADYTRVHYVYLAAKGERRVDGPSLIQSAQRDEESAQTYAAMLNEFYGALAQYNNLVPYADRLYNSLSTILSHTRLYY